MMETLSSISDEEREDGEIVDDDFEDISDYSIPSCGKSDYSESLISSLSLSSISVSDSEAGFFDKRQVFISPSEVHPEKKHVENVKCEKRKHVEKSLSKKKLLEQKKLLEKALLDESLEEQQKIESQLVTKKKRIVKKVVNDVFDNKEQLCCKSESAVTKTIRRRKRRPLVTPSVTTRRSKRRKSLNRSISSDSSSDGGDVLDRRTLHQLNKAVRIDSGDVKQNTLKDRLKRMIEPLEVSSVPSNAISIDLIEVSDDNNCENVLESQKAEKIDESMDKELEELRLQALKSAMLEKHMKRKRRKEIINSQAQNFELPNAHNNKENEEWNIPLPPTPPVEKIEKAEDEVKVEQAQFVMLESEMNVQKTDSDAHTQIKVEQLETKIVKLEQPQSSESDVKREKADVEDDLDIMRAMLLASMTKKITEDHQPSLTGSSRSSPAPPELPKDKLKPSISATVIKLPPVKPLIIRVNHPSESDSTDFEDLQPKIESSVEQLLRKQRQQFEANLQNNQTSELEQSLDKSILKLLPKSQQQEYKLLKQRLLRASKAPTKPVLGKQHLAAKSSIRDATKRDRLQPKGKFKELASLARKIHIEVEAKRRCQENVKKLMEELQSARMQLIVHQQQHATLVGQYKRARGLLEQRSAKSALEKKKQAQQLQQLQQKNERQVQPVQLPPKIIPTVVTHSNLLQNGVVNNVPDVKPTNVTPIDIPPSGTMPRSNGRIPSSTPWQWQWPLNHERILKSPLPTMSEAEQKVESSLASYVSPLDNNRGPGQPVKNNPLQMLCPYELFGMCKDTSCTFNHCP